MALGVNQTFKNFYTIRLGSLTTQHEIQSNRITLFTNEISDIAQKINFFENQKVLTLATPDNSKLAISAKLFDLPANFDPADANTWGSTISGSNTAKQPYYTTACQKELFIYKNLNTTDPNSAAVLAYNNTTDKDAINYSGNIMKDSSGHYWAKIPYVAENGANRYHTSDAAFAGYANTDQLNILDSRILSNRLMTGEYSFVYTDDKGVTQPISYKDLIFVNESQDKTAYQETTQELEAQSHNITEMQKKVQQEMQTTEVQIQAYQSMMDSTEKVLQKNTESFKWGA